jgi:small subunit ribosomal protein S3
MGQKVNPIVHRIGTYNNWKSKWFAKGGDVAINILEDYKIRSLIMSKMGPQAAISEIIIEKGLGRLSIIVKTARPGMLIGRGGKQLEMLREEITKQIKKKFKIEIVEVKKADLDAFVVAQTIGMQVSKRMPFRRACKQALQRIIGAGAKGARIAIAGRLDGAEIARTEKFSEGSVPLSTIKTDIGYGMYHAPTTFGIVGIKVWINLGERGK